MFQRTRKPFGGCIRGKRFKSNAVVEVPKTPAHPVLTLENELIAEKRVAQAQGQAAEVARIDRTLQRLIP